MGRLVRCLIGLLLPFALGLAGCDSGDATGGESGDTGPGALDVGRVDRGGADAAVDRGAGEDAAVDRGAGEDAAVDGGGADGAVDGEVADAAADGEVADAAADGEVADAAVDAEVDAAIPASCGDGVLDDGETCDDGPANSAVDPDACRLDCRPARCGDRVVDTGEQCDDGPANDAAADACRADCTPARCGDGVVDSGEGCDAGDDNGDAPGACRGDCQPAACGDGIVDPDETCDDGMDNSDEVADACRLDCEPSRCGDGVVDLGEGCDDGVANSDDIADACRRDCQPARCGDGAIDTGELCDGDRTCDPATCMPACVDDCALDALRCDLTATGIERCAEFDGDPCYEWGAGAVCAADEACSEGVCRCVDECDAGATRCAGDAIEHCRPQADGCLGWDPAEGCGDVLLRCEAGACARVPLVIDEVYYDAVGGDTPRVFTELWGPPGTPLDGLSLVGVNGNGGAVYGTVPLAGVIAADGFYVVAHVDAEPALAALADLLHRAVDWQNGPDSVQLRRGVEVLDAVGYGDFAQAVFAGEGRPAPDVAELSLSRDAAHGDTDDNLVDFTAGPPTPRASPAAVCVDDCALDAMRCVGDVGERCAVVDGCPAWVVVEDCAAAGALCVDGECVAGCEDDCAAGAARCAGDTVERCAAVGECLGWVGGDDCGARGEACQDGACVAAGGCGDGVLDAGEACDDGNLEIGDGCDDRCREEDPFDRRAVLIVAAPPAGERPDHVPEDMAATTYGGEHALRYDNERAYVFAAFDDNIRARVAEVELGRGVRLEPGDYAVVINDTFTRVVLDWESRAVVEASRLEVASPQAGHARVRPARRFDDIARPLPLRGCGPFGNQSRSPWIFGGCDGAVGGGEIELDRGLVVLPGSYRVSVHAAFHAPNDTFVEAPPGEVAVFVPPDVRARIEVLPPPAGALPDAVIAPVPSYGPPARRVPYDNDTYHVFRHVDVVTGFAYVATGHFGAPAVVPAGRYHVALNDTYVIATVAAGEHLRLPSGRVEVPGAGAFDLVPDGMVRRFTYVADPGACSRDGVETYVLASCAAGREGRFARGSGVTVMPGRYDARIYDAAGALLQVQALVVE